LGVAPAEGCTGADDGGPLIGVLDGVGGTIGADGVDVGTGGRKSAP
jgi:hypothetical protein